MAMKPDETASETAKPELVVQPGGRGALLTGGKPGNRGGGRPPSEFRRVARKLLHNRKLLPRLADIAEAKIGEIHNVIDAEGMTIKQYTETPIREQRGAIDTLVKIGVGIEKQISNEDVRDRLRQTLEIIRANTTDEVAESIIAQLEAVWR